MIVLISGHGGNDTGATYKTLVERDINWTITKGVYDLLKDKLHVTLEVDNGGVNEEVKFVNSQTYVDMVISIHNNAGGGDGFECFHYQGSQKGYKMCEFIEKEVVLNGQNSRGIKDGSHFKIIKGVKPPSIILEGFFLDNENDNKTSINDLINSYARGIAKYYNVEIDTKPPTSEVIYRVQVGAFRNKANANDLLHELKEKGYDCFITL